ncbi:MAG: right-handed parallel beta-helix repeat-containing protein [Chloroflexota bacterium]
MPGSAGTRTRVLVLGATAAFALACIGGPAAATETAAPPAVPAVDVAGVVAVPPNACRVSLAGTAYRSIAAAEAVATDGATIRVRGTCVGPTVIDTDLTILGVRNAMSGAPTLSGGKAGVVLLVRAGTELTLRDLTIRNGRNGANGGAIIARSALVVLDDTVVTANHASRGGGLWVIDSTLELRGTATVTRNRAEQNEGGGIYAERSSVRMYDTSSVAANVSLEDDGGGISLCGSSLEMFDRARIHHNRVRNDDGGGVDGGSCEGFDSSVTMHDDSRIDHNVTLYEDGGGVYLCNGLLRMEERASIDSNTAEDGGGADIECEASLAMTGSSVIGGNTAARGGGVHVCSGSSLIAAVLEDSSRIRANVATEEGGGVYLRDCESATLRVIDSAAIRGNSAEGNGGGIWSRIQPVILEGDGAVIANDAGGTGGGIYFGGVGYLTMVDDARIRANVHAAEANGAGVSTCGNQLIGVVALTNVVDNLAPNGPIGSPASIQVWERCD